MISPIAVPPELRAPIAVSLGAIAGALVRYYVTLLMLRWLGVGFPYGTLTVNLVGSGLMGVCVGIPSRLGLELAPELRLLVMVGVLGSLTTFSSYELDTVNLARSQGLLLALLYWQGSAILGLLSFWLGEKLAQIGAYS